MANNEHAMYGTQAYVWSTGCTLTSEVVQMSQAPEKVTASGRKGMRDVSQTLLQGGGRHAAHHHTVSVILLPSNCTQFNPQSHYSDLPLAVAFCWHSDLAAVQEVGFVALQTL